MKELVNMFSPHKSVSEKIQSSFNFLRIVNAWFQTSFDQMLQSLGKGLELLCLNETNFDHD